MGASLIGASVPTTSDDLDAAKVNVRIKIAALWASMLFVFVYVDLFSTYRADFRTDLAAGKVNGFTVGQTFLLATTAFVVIPSLMVFLTARSQRRSLGTRTFRRLLITTAHTSRRPRHDHQHRSPTQAPAGVVQARVLASAPHPVSAQPRPAPVDPGQQTRLGCDVPHDHRPKDR